MVSDVILTHCVQDRRLMLMLQLAMSLRARNEAMGDGGPGPGLEETFELFICRVVKHTHSQSVFMIR